MAFLLLAGTVGYQAGDPTEQIEYLRLSFKANKDAFAFGTFRFEYTVGSSASFSDAESGVFSKSVKEDGFFAFERKNARCELIADPKGLETVTTRIDERHASSLALTFRTLTDGKATLLDLIMLDERRKTLRHGPATEIYPGSSMFYNDAYFKFPLLLGTDEARPFDLFSDLNEIKNGNSSLGALDFESDLNGLKVCKLSLRYKEGERTYWIDVNRGCVPLRILDHYNGNGSESTYLFSDLEHVPNAGWLPRRRLRIVQNGGFLDRLVVTQIDVENKPQPSVFQLEFPEAITLVDRTRNLVSARRKIWSLLNPPSASSPGTRTAFRNAGGPLPEMPGEIDSRVPWTIILLTATIVLLIAGTTVVVRRRKRRLRAV
jgi:hypothetical protein